MRAQVQPTGDSSAEAVRCRPENYGSGVGTSLEYSKILIVIVDDPLPADGRSPIINTSCQSTMQICVAASDHRNLD
jgi:hypothetical protein